MWLEMNHIETLFDHTDSEATHRGKILIGVYKRKDHFITDEWNKKPTRRLYTWKAPADRNWNHLNYVLLKQRFRRDRKVAQTLLRADAVSDNNLLVATLCT